MEQIVLNWFRQIRFWNRKGSRPDTNSLNTRLRSLERRLSRNEQKPRPRLIRYYQSEIYTIPPVFTDQECERISEAMQDSRIGLRIRWLRGGGRGRSHQESIEYEGLIIAIVPKGQPASEYVAKHFIGQKLASCNQDVAIQNDRFLIRSDSGRWALLAFHHASYEFVHAQTQRSPAPDPVRKYLRRPGF